MYCLGKSTHQERPCGARKGLENHETGALVRSTLTLLTSALFLSSLTACTALDANFVADGDKPLYYTCTLDGDECAPGFTCSAAELVTLKEENSWERYRLCLPEAAVAPPGCGVLEDRGGTCQFAFGCVEGTVPVANDIMGCPLGFARSTDDPETCELSDCGDAAFGGLVGFQNGREACVTSTSEAGPYKGAPSVRVYCALGADKVCPAGWTLAAPPEACRPDLDTEYCNLLATAPSWTPEATERVSAGSFTVIVPYGSAQSCRPVPQ
ncbi:MAG: hypothetical protein AUK47_26920 [Deltaproteobacteria bacterium CG2_30_63_29]|nr:MAG: hypothetical protein AUK47_26920 [Deltaproteobacteria bacterium CG2_30_63_29]PIV99206.1 MAG: hypothetical protein COW42_11760 [Deltaproteobacteria bacterium CG17_big_fil_post_rev_8_21_14_2_50_63_7]PJB34284.1 MAG: hypothetical protein CO108_28735 [Deltaproteobacteria bacterium CG_4_9_14_3_um_filter_63_12]